MKNRRLLPALLILVFAIHFLLLMSHAANPPTPRKPVTDEYHGVKVMDDYRWLEDGNDPAVKAWSAEENRLTRDYLDALPDRAAIGKKLTELYSKDSPGYGAVVPRAGRLFALKYQPPKQQPMIVSLASPDDLASEKILLDPNELEPKGKVAIDWFSPSLDGSLVAVCLSKNGSEDGVLHFYRTDTGEALSDRIPRVQYPTAGGSVAWAPDGKSVFYTRYPHTGEKPEADLNFFQQIYTHKLGDPESADAYSLGKDFPENRRDRAYDFTQWPLAGGLRSQWRWRRVCALCAGPQ